MNPTWYKCIKILFISLTLSIYVKASNKFLYPNLNPSYSNYSTIGLIQVPSARFLSEGTASVNWANFDPYLRGAVVAYPFDWMEAAYIYTDINNALYSTVKAFSGGQSYKDKGFDAKFRILKESTYLPNIAVGFRDVGGGNLFEAEYIVMSKYYRNLDISLGAGWGHLASGDYKNPFSSLFGGGQIRDPENVGQGGKLNLNRFFRGPMGIFGGVEYFVPRFNGLRLKLEYDSTQYSQEGFPFGRASSEFAYKPVKQTSSRLNFGVVYPWTQNLMFKFAFVKGHTFNFGFSYSLDLSLSDGVVKKSNPFKEVENPEIIQKLSAEDDINFYRLLLNRMNDRDLSMQHANLYKDTASVVYTQSVFTSHTRAIGRALRVLDAVAPQEVKSLEVMNINSNLGMYRVKVDRNTFSKYIDTNYYPLVQREMTSSGLKYNDIDTKYNPTPPYPSHHYYISPYLRTQIGGPEGFIFGDLRIGLESEFQITRGFSIFTQAGVGVTSNLNNLNNPSDSVLPHVRTDIIKYLKESKHFQIDRMNITKFYNPSVGQYVKLQLGILEPMFSGFGGEYLYKPFHKDYAIGFEAWRVKQRDYDMKFDHLEYETNTGHINFYYQEPKSKVLINIRGGRFLAKDSGLHFNFSRRFKSGFTIGAFFSRTDISDFEFGEGSFDKGFYFFIPMEIFTKNYSKRTVPWGLRPLTRDGAAFLEHAYNLYGVTEQANYEAIFRDIDDLYD